MKFARQVSLAGRVVIIVDQGLPCGWELLFKRLLNQASKLSWSQVEDKHAQFKRIVRK